MILECTHLPEIWIWLVRRTQLLISELGLSWAHGSPQSWLRGRPGRPVIKKKHCNKYKICCPQVTMPKAQWTVELSALALILERECWCQGKRKNNYWFLGRWSPAPSVHLRHQMSFFAKKRQLFMVIVTHFGKFRTPNLTPILDIVLKNTTFLPLPSPAWFSNLATNQQQCKTYQRRWSNSGQWTSWVISKLVTV